MSVKHMQVRLENDEYALFIEALKRRSKEMKVNLNLQDYLRLIILEAIEKKEGEK